MAQTTNNAHWVMKKEINLAHILVSVGMLVTSFVYISDLERRIAGSEKDIAYIQKQRLEDNKRIEKRLDSIDSKLDRLLAK